MHIKNRIIAAAAIFAFLFTSLSFGAAGGESLPADIQWHVKPYLEAEIIEPKLLRPYNKVMRGLSNETMKHLDDGLSVIKANGKQGLIDQNGKVIADTVYDDIDVGYQNRYVLSIYGAGDAETDYYTLNADNSLKQISEMDMLRYRGTAPNFSGTWVKKLGTIAIYFPEDNSITVYRSNDVIALPISDSDYSLVAPGQFELKGDWRETEKYAICNDGKLVTKAIYDNAASYSGGLIAVKQNGKWGYADANGNLVIPCKYDADWYTEYSEEYHLPYSASGGYVVLSRGGKKALYDIKGNVKYDFGVFEDISPVHDGKFWAKTGGKWGVVKI